MTENDNIFTIHVFIALQVIQSAGESPRPNPDTPPFFLSGLRLSFLIKQRMQPILKSIIIIRIQIAVVYHSQSVTLTQNIFYRPPGCSYPTRAFIYLIVFNHKRFIIPGPALGYRNMFRWMNGMIAIKIESEKNRNRTAGVGR